MGILNVYITIEVYKGWVHLATLRNSSVRIRPLDIEKRLDSTNVHVLIRSLWKKARPLAYVGAEFVSKISNLDFYLQEGPSSKRL